MNTIQTLLTISVASCHLRHRRVHRFSLKVGPLTWFFVCFQKTVRHIFFRNDKRPQMSVKFHLYSLRIRSDFSHSQCHVYSWVIKGTHKDVGQALFLYSLYIMKQQCECHSQQATAFHGNVTFFEQLSSRGAMFAGNHLVTFKSLSAYRYSITK